MLPTRSIPVRKPSRKPPFARSSMPDARFQRHRAAPPTGRMLDRPNIILDAPMTSGPASPAEHRRTAIALASELCDTRPDGGVAPPVRRRGPALTEIWIVFAHHRRRHRPLRLGPAAGRSPSASAARWRSGRPGVLTLNQALAGFGDPATIFVTSLFVVSARAGEDRRHRLGRADARRAAPATAASG